MSSKKKRQTLPGYYVNCKELRERKKRGEKTAYIRMSLKILEMNKEIIKERKSKFPNV